MIKYNPNRDPHFTPHEVYEIQAVHDILSSQVPVDRRIKNPRDKSINIIKQCGAGVGITESEIAGIAARYGAIGTLSLTGVSKDFFHNRDNYVPNIEELSSMEVPQRYQILEKYMPAIEEIHKTLIKSKGGMISQNTLSKVIDFERNFTLTKDAFDFFYLTGYSVLSVQGEFDFVDSPAGWERFQISKTKQYNQDGEGIPLIHFLSDVDQWKSRIRGWSKRPESRPEYVIFENGSAAGHNGSIKTRDEVLSEFAEFILDESNFSVMPKYIMAGGMHRGKDLVEAILDYEASAVQIGTRFVATQESSASDLHKQMILDAKRNKTMNLDGLDEEQIQTLKSVFGENLDNIGQVPSTSGMLATGFRTPAMIDIALGSILRKQPCSNLEKLIEVFGENVKLEEHGCLIRCGYSDKSMEIKEGGDYCIESSLRAAKKGNLKKGQFFASLHSDEIPENESLPFRQVLGNIYLEAYEEINGNEKRSEIADKLAKRKQYLKENPGSLTHRLFTKL